MKKDLFIPTPKELKDMEEMSYILLHHISDGIEQATKLNATAYVVVQALSFALVSAISSIADELGKPREETVEIFCKTLMMNAKGAVIQEESIGS